MTRKGGSSPHRVHEKLRAATVRLAGVGHRERARFVAELLGELIGDVSTAVAGDGLAVGAGEGGAAVGAARAGAAGLGVLRVRAPKLKHEVLDYAVERAAVVKALVGESNEVRGRDRHRVKVELAGEGALAGVEGGDLITREEQ